MVRQRSEDQVDELEPPLKRQHLDGDQPESASSSSSWNSLSSINDGVPTSLELELMQVSTSQTVQNAPETSTHNVPAAPQTPPPSPAAHSETVAAPAILQDSESEDGSVEDDNLDQNGFMIFQDQPDMLATQRLLARIQIGPQQILLRSEYLDEALQVAGMELPGRTSLQKAVTLLNAIPTLPDEQLDDGVIVPIRQTVAERLAFHFQEIGRDVFRLLVRADRLQMLDPFIATTPALLEAANDVLNVYEVETSGSIGYQLQSMAQLAPILPAFETEPLVENEVARTAIEHFEQHVGHLFIVLAEGQAAPHG